LRKRSWIKALGKFVSLTPRTPPPAGPVFLLGLPHVHSEFFLPRQSRRYISFADIVGISDSTGSAGCSAQNAVKGMSWAELTRIVHSSVARPPAGTGAVAHGVWDGCPEASW